VDPETVPESDVSIFLPPSPRHILVPIRGDEATCFTIGQAQSESADPSGRSRRTRRRFRRVSRLFPVTANRVPTQVIRVGSRSIPRKDQRRINTVWC